MMAHLLALASALNPSRKAISTAVELAGLAGVVYGIHGWNTPASFVAGGVGLVLEAYALERR